VESDQAKAIVQACMAQRKYRMTRHFMQRLEERIFFW